MVYLIHFEEKLHHAQHYIGYTNCLERRLHEHLSNSGAKILKAVKAAGIKYRVVKVWEDGDRSLERKLKNRKKARCMCPVCQGKEEFECNQC